MPDNSATSQTARKVRELLELDRSLTPSDRKVLESVLLAAHPASARELARSTRANLQALYGSLERLEHRGLVVRERNGSAMTFQAAHPSVVLEELLLPWRRAQQLAGELETPLRQLYDEGRARPSSEGAVRAIVTESFNAASSWLVDGLGKVASEVWFLGSEEPWVGRSSAVESELAARRTAPGPLRVRLLVRDPAAQVDRARNHARLRKSGAEVRYSDAFSSPAVILDRRWVFLQTTSGPGAARGSDLYVRLDSPALGADLVAAGEQVWARAASSAGRAPAP